MAILPVIEEKEFGKIYNIVTYKFHDLFVVKLTVRPKGSWYKIKDVEFFSIQECTSSQFSSAIVSTSLHISSVELFNQMTFAGRRVRHFASLSCSSLSTVLYRAKKMRWKW